MSGSSFSPSFILTPALNPTKLLTLLYVAAGSLFIALCAQIRIPLPFTPIPITMQTFGVMLVASTLGARLGTLSVLMYIAEALVGLPVLSGGISNPIVLLSIKGGYLVGFCIQAYVAGRVIERQGELGKILLFTGLILATSLQLICGSLWLSYFLGWRDAITLGVIPFVPGEIFKVIALMGILVYPKVLHCRHATYNR